MKKLFIILIMLSCAITAYGPGLKKDLRSNIEKYLCTALLTHDNLQLALEINGIIAADIVRAQSHLETGNFQSDLCGLHNNLFGMKQPHVRATTAIGANEKGYAIYRSWYDSVKDIKLFQEWYLERGRDLSDYHAFLASIGYAEDVHYLAKVNELCTTSR